MSAIARDDYLGPRLRQFAAAAPDAELHHMDSDHAHPGGHQRTPDCPACAAGRTDHPLPKEVIEKMAMREHRMHHWLWHQVRNNWYRYPRDIQQKIDALGWKPPRPVVDENGNPNLKNDSGEDFLYMHRQMIRDVNAILAKVGDPNFPQVQGWLVPPPPGDPSFPVPPAWFDPESQAPTQMPVATLERIKSDVFYAKRFLFWQKTYTDPKFLRGVTLGELGVMIELTIHNFMHIRWAASLGSSRPDPLQPSGDIDPTQGDAIGMEWDDPRYNFLQDFYSSHVNPIFWKLHGWIDDRIGEWQVANGVFGNDFWKGKWIGKMPGHEAAAATHALPGGPEHAVSPMAEMHQVMNLIARAGVFHRLFMPSFSIEDW